VEWLAATVVQSKQMKVGPFATWVAGVLLAGAAGASDLPEIQARGTLRVLAVTSSDETYFVSDAPRGGFDWELLEGFARLHRLKLELTSVAGWNELIPALTRGRGDLIAGGFTATEARRKQIAFTAETFPTRSVVITRKPTRLVQTLDELKAEKIGTLKGTFMYDDLLAAGIAAGRIDDTVPTGGIPEALQAGTITAGVDGIEAALIAKNKDPELQIGMFLGEPASLAYGVRQEDAQLLKVLDEYVANVRRTPTWSRLAVKYFGASAPEILKKARGE
jgi:ABC-type amino acid transport substrate-binding protein